MAAVCVCGARWRAGEDCAGLGAGVREPGGWAVVGTARLGLGVSTLGESQGKVEAEEQHPTRPEVQTQQTPHPASASQLHAPLDGLEASRPGGWGAEGFQHRWRWGKGLCYCFFTVAVEFLSVPIPSACWSIPWPKILSYGRSQNSSACNWVFGSGAAGST